MKHPRSRADWRKMSAKDRREPGAPPDSCYLKIIAHIHTKHGMARSGE